MIDALFRVKSNLDSGIPQAIQCAAIDALDGERGDIVSFNTTLQRRRDRLIGALNAMGLEAEVPKATFYIWVRVPQGWSSVDFADILLDEADIVVTPGIGYGKEGDGYVRFSLTLPDERLEKGIDRLLLWWKNFKGKPI
jgi:LL-diaminopimelate aminotransferase